MRKLYTLLLLLIGSTTFAQNPTVIGDSMLCPNSSGLLTTQTYDTYQWFVRYFGSSTIAPIAGANSQTLPIDYSNYAASYLSVEVTLGANDYISPGSGAGNSPPPTRRTAPGGCSEGRGCVPR